ncbi:phosphoribosylglycinamide formyltransferase [Allorhizobium taibaishanense]|uniref:phosphoribosylglycinamide formyltransferase 1 n=1 Tax=Allorhizobium taibaishanense TaxID=887144 RepID=A0A1Q9A2N0_9HYPH|nr:phosphoribosylglycinamide formyltransferase [Allorhizobium taibaishanense]MBB4008965.1 phosphoribosylglycinamide formyltransferase-1 [Allorhizobium taibaishanense]OLP48715.1 phosphoribosylglycinamide formyltransferase [Allorhizobium taibaishanense]
MQKLRVAFLASNNGTSFRAINHAIIANSINASAVVLISNRRDSTALAYAQANGIPSRHIPTHNREADADREVKDMLLAHGAQIVVLSGYLKKLGPLTLDTFRGKILNVHPGLLPKYGGLGMYGQRVHHAVLENQETETGATIHVVDEEYDHGRTLATAIVKIEPSDDVVSLEQRVMSAECALFTDLIRRITEGEVRLPF